MKKILTLIIVSFGFLTIYSQDLTPKLDTIYNGFVYEYKTLCDSLNITQSNIEKSDSHKYLEFYDQETHENIGFMETIYLKKDGSVFKIQDNKCDKCLEELRGEVSYNNKKYFFRIDIQKDDYKIKLPKGDNQLELCNMILYMLENSTKAIKAR